MIVRYPGHREIRSRHRTHRYSCASDYGVMLARRTAPQAAGADRQRVMDSGLMEVALGAVERLCAPANGSLARAVATASRPSQSYPSVAGAPFGTDPRLACSLRIAPGTSGAI